MGSTISHFASSVYVALKSLCVRVMNTKVLDNQQEPTETEAAEDEAGVPNDDAPQIVAVRMRRAPNDDDDSDAAQQRTNTGEQIRSKHRQLLEQSAGLTEQLKDASTAYSETCEDFYNTFIVKTMQDSTRTTLESIVKAKTRQTENEKDDRKRDTAERELKNIYTAIKVFGDRQDVLTKRVDACHQSFKEARSNYEHTKEKLAEITRQLSALHQKLVPARGQHVLIRGSQQLKDAVKRDLAEFEGQMVSIEQHIRKKLRKLRRDYTENQPPTAVTV